MNPQAHLASMARRIAAFTIDTLLLIPVAAMLIALLQGLSAGVELEMSGSLLLWALFHWAALVNRNYDLGRVIVGVQVISLKAGPDLSAFQCFIRPASRVAMLLAAFFSAIGVHEPLVIFAPLLADLLLLTFNPTRQTLADLISGTIVVTTPPLQPHRAPAGPMFSRDDTEFGPKPRGGKSQRP